MGTATHFEPLPAGALRLAGWKFDSRAGYRPVGDWRILPPRFLDAVRAAVPFASRQPSDKALMGVMLAGQHVYATDRVVAVQIDAGGELPKAVIPLALGKAMIKRAAAPVEMLVQADRVAFSWDDGTWIDFASLHDGPDQLPAAFADWEEPDWQVPADWKAAGRKIAKAGDRVFIAPDSLRCGSPRLDMETAIENPVQGTRIFSAAALKSAIAVAERLSLATQPARLSFRHGRGLIMGMIL